MTMELEKKVQAYFLLLGSNIHHPVLYMHAVYGDNICYLIFSRLDSAICSISKLVFSFEHSRNVCSGVSLHAVFHK